MKKIVSNTNLIMGVTLILILGSFIFLGKAKIGNDPEDVVYKYLSAESDEARKEFLLNDTKMPEYFIENELITTGEKFKKSDYIFETEYMKRDVVINEGEYTRVKVYPLNGSGRTEDSDAIFYLKNMGDKYLIDFNPSVIDNQKDLPLYFVDGFDGDINLKLYAVIDTYNFKRFYNEDDAIKLGLDYEGEDIPHEYNALKDNYYIALKDPITGYTIQGEIKKNTKEGEYLYGYLKEGGYKQVLLNVTNITKDDSGIFKVRINDVVSFDWSGVKKYNFRDW
ncbi:MAG: hypothetical protein ACRC7N_09285 [Clostridium sp.]